MGGGGTGQTLGAGPSGYNPFSTATSNVAQQVARPANTTATTATTNQATTNPTATTATTTATPTGTARVASNQNWNLEPGQVTRNMAGRFIYLDPTTGQYMNTGNKDFALYSAGPNATMQAAPEGFKFARGDYRFGQGTVGKYDGQYVFKDPVTGRYLSTGNQADAYLRAFGNNGDALTMGSNGTFYGGERVGMLNPQQYAYSSGKDLYNALNPTNAFGMSTGPTVSRDIANQMYGYGAQVQGSQNAFNTLYHKLLEGTFQGQNVDPILNYLVDYSKQADAARTGYMGLAEQYAPRSNSMAGAGGGVQSQFIPQQSFTLPKETWNMNPQQLMNWINNYEKEMGEDSFMGDLAWAAGTGAITGAGAMGLTGITNPFSLTNSLIGSGIQYGGNINNRASGGIIDLKRGK